MDGNLLEKEWFIEAPWGRISIIAWGNCQDPPALLCHGHMDSAASFRPLMRLLPDKFYYIAMELPGNGRSDPFPNGLMIHAYDMMYAMRVVVKHFRWSKFVYIAHSLGTLLGKLYAISYPGEMQTIVDLDPIPAYDAVETTDFAMWYHKYYSQYFNRYEKFNAPVETAPKYRREKALDMLKRNRGLSDEAAASVLERITEPVGDGLVRFTLDQRTKLVTRPPFPASYRKKLFTGIDAPTLSVLCDSTVKYGFYDRCPFSMDESAYPKKNYRYRIVEGHHDIHIVCPEKVAPYVSQFLLYGPEGLDANAKL